MTTPTVEGLQREVENLRCFIRGIGINCQRAAGDLEQVAKAAKAVGPAVSPAALEAAKRIAEATPTSVMGGELYEFATLDVMTIARELLRIGGET